MPEEGLPEGAPSSKGESNNATGQPVTPPAGAKAGATPPPKPPAAKPAAKAPAVMASTPWDDELPRQLKAAFPDGVLECATYLGQDFVLVRPEAAVAVLEFLKLEAAYDYLVDVTAVHYPNRKDEEFDLFYVLYSFSRNHRLRVKTRLKDGAPAESACRVHLTANWLEREVFDMFGIRFNNHPDLKRILMPEEWEGHPLRKDYNILKMDERWVQENLGIESAQ
jgi:NADH-quinone oxidoreductase subunit C